ncbi:hypothetical protein ACUODJ_49105, partial [Escherichia sp. HC-CC]
TSPHYGIVASTETAAAMMKGNAGKRLINGSIERAIKFRKEIKRLRTESDGWFFDVWQPDHIDTTECWPLRSDSTWHGFKNIDMIRLPYIKEPAIRFRSQTFDLFT